MTAVLMNLPTSKGNRMNRPLSRREFLESTVKHTALIALASGLAAGCRAGRPDGRCHLCDFPLIIALPSC
jgi:hypothetical protein